MRVGRLGETLRLPFVNATGFSASTVMPLWLEGIAGVFHMPAWFAGAAVLAQLGGAALLNLLTPILFPRAPLLPLARAGLLLAAAAYLLALSPPPALFLLACLLCGAGLGVTLNVTNRLMGSAEHVQQGYAVFVGVEVCFATLLFLGCTAVIGRFGLLALFPVVAAVALIACAALRNVRIAEAPTRAEVLDAPPHRGRAFLALAAFALFFVGQATINAFMPRIGEAAGLAPQAARATIGLGMPCGFAGALLARLLGERVSPIAPVTAVVVLLALAAALLTLVHAVPVFVAGVVALAFSTIFVVPYFFAQLGALDGRGRYAAFGPAMMLFGIAIGPSAAVMLDAQAGLAAVGAFSTGLLLAGGVAFACAVLPQWGRAVVRGA